MSESARAWLAESLRARREEIEEALLTRVGSIADPTETADPEYVHGVGPAIAAAVEYGLASIERGDRDPPQVPAVLLIQTRLAARNSVPLDTVLRRYFAGYALLVDCLVDEAERGDLLGNPELRQLARSQAGPFDRLIAAIGEEHRREAGRRPSDFEQRRVEHVERLLMGELTDASELAYDFDGWHLGAVASGPAAVEAVRSLSRALDTQFLIVPKGDQIAWGWLNGRQRIGSNEVKHAIEKWPKDTALGLGEPARAMNGWRLTHRQAGAALTVAQRGGESPVHYADVPLVTSSLTDDLLGTSLRQLYLAPLARERDGGKAARETLHAYFAARRNASSAAASLGVSRQAVNSRLRTIEERLGQSLDNCSTELEVALHMHELEDTAAFSFPSNA